MVSSFHELRLHAYNIHKQKNSIRALVDSTFCQACLREHHTRFKMVSHVSYSSPACKHFYMFHVVPPCPELVLTLDLADSLHTKELKAKGFGPKYHPISSYRFPGPKPPNSYFFLIDES